MMQIVHDPHVAVWYIAVSMVLMFLGSWMWLVWWKLRGMRGMLTAIMLTSLSIIVGCQGALQTADLPWINDTHVAEWIILVIARTMWAPVMVSGILTVDIYLADNNEHRALTTILYLWYIKQRARRGMEHPRSYQE